MAPVCTIFGDANGTGKSSLVAKLKPVGAFVNADMAARALDPIHPERAAMAAGRAVVARLRTLTGERRDFVYETTLSSRQAVNLMRQAGQAGYEVGLVFVVLVDPDLHVARVADRVRKGGHDIPEAVIRRRCKVAFDRLAAAIPFAQGALIYDNSGRDPEHLLSIDGGAVGGCRLDPGRASHVRIARAVAEALTLDMAALLTQATKA